MKTTEKDFDCIAMKRTASLRIHDALKEKTREEKLAYWQHKNEEFRRQFPGTRTLGDSNPVRP